MSIRTLLYLRPAATAAWAGLVLTLAGCTAQAPAPTAGEGQLFARGLDEIADLYIQPVANRRLVLSGMARLVRVDDELGVSDRPANGDAGALALSYGGHDIGLYAVPADADRRAWGKLVANLITAGRRASPRLAALPQETIEKAVFDGMTASLDRFSRYSGPEAARAQRAARDGFGGIGVSLDATNETYRITGVAPAGPADRAGIRPEDEIVAIDGVATAGRSHDEVVHQLRGPVGSVVAISVLHPGTEQRGDLRLNRELVIAPTVTASRDGDIAVFRIATFNRSTTQRIADGLADVQRQTGQPLAGIVLDLRGSPGGLLDQAVSLVDLFIHNGPIVSTVGRHPASLQYFAASGGGVALRTPLAVLINGGSASAAEIVAAALQDVGRAVVVGSSSYGKGTVQTVLRLPNDGELTITWAWLVTPSGYFLQTHGVVPTLCTTDLGDDERSIEVGVQRVSVLSPSALPRKALDERGWSELRRSCPARRTSPEIDLKLAERLLSDPTLYSEALQALPLATRLTANAPAGGRLEPVLTGLNGALSSPLR